MLLLQLLILAQHGGGRGHHDKAVVTGSRAPSELPDAAMPHGFLQRRHRFEKRSEAYIGK